MKLRLLALVAASTLVLAGCGDDSTSTADPGSSTAPSSTTPSSPSAGSSGPAESAAPDGGGTTSYVALGDSYTAAPLVPDTDQGDACLRSSNNYPALVAKANPDLALTDVSCAGADSTSMIGVQTIGSDVNPAQFDALDDSTKVVTLGLGGNDFNLFSSLLADCASSSDVTAEGKPCTDAATSGGAEDLSSILPQTKARISAVITGIKDRAPNAQLIVVGYPRLAPDTGSCDKLAVVPGDYAYVRSLNTGLNDAISQAAKTAGVDFIDIYAASKGHDICSTDPWVNGKDTDPNAALAYHPFAAEQQAVADLIDKVLEPTGAAS